MEVVLLEKIGRLGDIGDTVKVKAGFGRNYLVPQGKAVYATKKNLEIFESRRADLEKQEAEKLKVAQERSEKIASLGAIKITAVVGEEGKGVRYILDGLNAERILISHESLGDARWFIKKAVDYANEREVFGRPIGKNQGVQFPIAKAYANTEAAALMSKRAAELFESGETCGAESNMAQMLAADAAWEAGDTCMQTFGGFAFAEEYDVERKYREARLYRVAPISTNLVLGYLAEHILGLPRSY